MIGIYDDSFITYLKNNLNCIPKIRTKNIVVRCPWCEISKEKKEYNLWISTEAPIFKCFSGGCGHHGLLKKFLSRINGKDNISDFVNEEIQSKIQYQKKIDTNTIKNYDKNIILPPLNEDFYLEKSIYIKRRLKYYNIPLSFINGLVFDIEKFIKMNDIKVSDKVKNIFPFLNSNFVGFLSNHKNILMMRNIDSASSFKHFKIDIQKNNFLDYYQLNGLSKNSNEIVASEGIFDILTEHIFDTINIKQNIRLYAAGFSTSYNELFKSLSFNNQIFRMKVHILSDRDISLKFYEKIKKANNHLIEGMNVYYNKTGKDFNDNPCIPVRYLI